jgi:hypothetical protein
MTFRRGMRRLALFLGVLGMIAGGIGSYIELSSLLAERSNHRKFGQLVSLDAVQNERKLLKSLDSGVVPRTGDEYNTPIPPGATIGSPAPPNGEKFFPNPDYRPPAGQGSEQTKLTKSGIAEIHWTPDNEVDYLKAIDGQYYFAGFAPGWWQYLLALALPVIGFLIPWGFVNALVWVGFGFIEPQC